MACHWCRVLELTAELALLSHLLMAAACPRAHVAWLRMQATLQVHAAAQAAGLQDGGSGDRWAASQLP